MHAAYLDYGGGSHPPNGNPARISFNHWAVPALKAPPQGGKKPTKSTKHRAGGKTTTQHRATLAPVELQNHNPPPINLVIRAGKYPLLSHIPFANEIPATRLTTPAILCGPEQPPTHPQTLHFHRVSHVNHLTLPAPGCPPSTATLSHDCHSLVILLNPPPYGSGLVLLPPDPTQHLLRLRVRVHPIGRLFTGRYAWLAFNVGPIGHVFEGGVLGWPSVWELSILWLSGDVVLSLRQH